LMIGKVRRANKSFKRTSMTLYHLIPALDGIRKKRTPDCLTI